MSCLLRQPLTGGPLPNESMDSWRLGLARLQGLERVAPQHHLLDPALDPVENKSPTPSNEGGNPDYLNSLVDDGFSLPHIAQRPSEDDLPISRPPPDEKGKLQVSSSTCAELDVTTTTDSPKAISPIPGQNDCLEASFESRVTMFEGLHELLVGESRVALAEIRQLTSSAPATYSEDSSLVSSETLHELNRLMTMAKNLEEITVSASRR